MTGDTPWSDPEHDVLGDIQRVLEDRDLRGLGPDSSPPATSTPRGSRPFLGWVDEFAEFQRALEGVDLALKWRPSPDVEAKVRELFEAGTVHRRGDASALFADPVDRERESDMVHAHRTAIEALVARYAAEHPDEIRG